MRAQDLTEEEFLQRVAEHQMLVLRDEGLYRHLRFRRPETIIDGFDIVTWPGHLCYTGDMGSFLFARSLDMFSFFRDTGSGPLHTSRDYWAQKAVAVDRNGIEKYDPCRLIDAVWGIVKSMDNLNDAEKDDLVGEATSAAYDGRDLATAKALDTIPDLHDSLLDVSLMRWNYHFEWCCFALPWAIRQYDAAMKAAARSDS